MARVTFTKEQLLAGKMLPPGWYTVLVKSFQEEPAGTDGSANYIYSLVVDDDVFKGVPVRFQANEKWYTGEFIEFLDILLGGIQPGVAVDFDKLVGKKVQAFIQRGEYKGRPQNQCVSFRKYEAGGEAQAGQSR